MADSAQSPAFDRKSREISKPTTVNPGSTVIIAPNLLPTLSGL
ncbi:hypothetical protein ACLUXI_06325 [Bifidobacterium apri]